MNTLWKWSHDEMGSLQAQIMWGVSCLLTYLVSKVILVNVHRDYVITLICRNKSHKIRCFVLSKRLMDDVAILIIYPCFKRVF